MSHSAKMPKKKVTLLVPENPAAEVKLDIPDWDENDVEMPSAPVVPSKKPVTFAPASPHPNSLKKKSQSKINVDSAENVEEKEVSQPQEPSAKKSKKPASAPASSSSSSSSSPPAVANPTPANPVDVKQAAIEVLEAPSEPAIKPKLTLKEKKRKLKEMSKQAEQAEESQEQSEKVVERVVKPKKVENVVEVEQKQAPKPQKVAVAAPKHVEKKEPEPVEPVQPKKQKKQKKVEAAAEEDEEERLRREDEEVEELERALKLAKKPVPAGFETPAVPVASKKQPKKPLKEMPVALPAATKPAAAAAVGEDEDMDEPVAASTKEVSAAPAAAAAKPKAAPAPNSWAAFGGFAFKPKDSAGSSSATAAAPAVVYKPATALAAGKFEQKLKGARFRMLNEQLYTIRGEEAFQVFGSDPSLFQDYHEGFRQQVQFWPKNPVDAIIARLKKKHSGSRIADFGCGDAKIAQVFGKDKVHSFDLVAVNEYVTACDMAHVPLEDGTMEVAVFCLSLMGVNFADYLKEAHRILKNNGTLLIAEVASRITSIKKFMIVLERLGFAAKTQDLTDTHFVLFSFVKDPNLQPKEVASAGILMPCLYKKR